MRIATAGFTLLVGIVLATSPILAATELDQGTSQAWNEYIQATNLKMQQRAAGTDPFLWIDEAPGRREAVRQGQILVEPTQKDSPARMGHGLVFDWTGAVFFPNTTIHHIFEVLNQFDRYDEFYNPAVISAKLLQDTPRSQRFSMIVTKKTAFLSTTVESEYISQTTCLDKRHCYNIIYSTRIQQIENYNSPAEQKLPPGEGFLWRLYSIQRYEEQDGGVYAELESIALTRTVPLDLLWLLKPIVQHLPRNSMAATLQKTREAVCAGEQPARKDEEQLSHRAPVDDRVATLRP